MTPANGRQRVLNLIHRRPVDSLPLMPITMMFATDRIGRKYRDYVTDHRVLVEAQLRVAEEFDFDHVSCISDPAREAADCGAPVVMLEDQPPAFDESNALLSDKSRLLNLKAPDPLAGGRMTDRVRAVALFKQRLNNQKLIEGWIEGPCAQGADLRGLNNLMMDFFEDPPFIKDLFEFVIHLELPFARAQIDAGADLIGIGDAAASLIGPNLYNEFVFPYEKRLIDAIHAMGSLVRLHICGNTRPLLESLGRLGADIVDLDYPSPLAEARTKMGSDQILLGNLHPVTALRNSNPAAITAALADCHHQAGPRYIVGAGCEIPRDTPVANVHALTQYARSHR
jgi:MtaA/CmuA family methyltransferase